MRKGKLRNMQLAFSCLVERYVLFSPLEWLMKVLAFYLFLKITSSGFAPFSS